MVLVVNLNGFVWEMVSLWPEKRSSISVLPAFAYLLFWPYP